MSSKVSFSGVNEIIADSISLQEGNAIVNFSDNFLNKSEAYNKTQINTTFFPLYYK